MPLPNHKCDFDDSGQVNAYELSSAAWADLDEVEFDRLRRRPYLVGEFVWTGFDYLREPTPYDQRARSSCFVIVNLAGLPKHRYYLYRSRWRQR